MRLKCPECGCEEEWRGYPPNPLLSLVQCMKCGYMGPGGTFVRVREKEMEKMVIYPEDIDWKRGMRFDEYAGKVIGRMRMRDKELEFDCEASEEVYVVLNVVEAFVRELKRRVWRMLGEEKEAENRLYEGHKGAQN